LGFMRRYGASCSTEKVAQLSDALKEAKVCGVCLSRINRLTGAVRWWCWLHARVWGQLQHNKVFS
jgi:hypothetical protein